MSPAQPEPAPTPASVELEATVARNQMSLSGATAAPVPQASSVSHPARARIANLYDDLLREVAGDHGGLGTILAHRAYRREGAPAPITFVDLCVLPPHSSIGLHRHGDDQETYIILSGQGRMTRDGEEFDVCEGDVIPNSPYGEHGLVNDSDVQLKLLVLEVGPLGGAR